MRLKGLCESLSISREKIPVIIGLQPEMAKCHLPSPKKLSSELPLL
jgi:hypothetical protein